MSYLDYLKEYLNACKKIDMTSRKYRLIKVLLVVLTALFIVPPLGSFIAQLCGYNVELVLLPATLYLIAVGALAFIYLLANVSQKKLTGAGKLRPENLRNTNNHTEPDA